MGAGGATAVHVQLPCVLHVDRRLVDAQRLVVQRPAFYLYTAGDYNLFTRCGAVHHRPGGTAAVARIECQWFSQPVHAALESNGHSLASLFLRECANGIPRACERKKGVIRTAGCAVIASG